MYRFALPFAALFTLACADVPAGDDDAGGVLAGEAALDLKADGSSGNELRVRAGEMSVWLRTATEVGVGDFGTRVVIFGRASRDLDNAFSWVPDDAFGEAQLTSARKFKVVLDEGHEVNSILSGQPIFVTLHAKTGTLRDYVVRIALEPRLYGFTGSRQIWLRDAVLPVYVRDGLSNLRYRGHATVNDDTAALEVEADDAPTVIAEEPGDFAFDWTYEGLAQALTPSHDTFSFIATSETLDAEKRAKLAPFVVKVAMTADDPYNDLIPLRTCDETVRQCIVDAGDLADLGHCAVYREVQICMASLP